MGTPDPSSTVAAAVEAVGGEEAVATAPKSLVARFLEVRGLERPLRTLHTQQEIVATSGNHKEPAATAPSAPPPTALSPPLAPPPLWHGYTKRRCGERTLFIRQALLIPDESYRDSVDIYNPPKKPTQLIKIHKDAQQANDQFLYQARRLLFEREIVDRVVCDLEENRFLYDENLDEVYALTSEEEENDGAVDGGGGSEK